MKKPWALAFIFIIPFVIAACSGDSAPKDDKDSVRLVKTVVISDKASGDYRQYPGKVSASESVKLAFEVPGRIIEFPVKEGNEIKKGGLIAKLDPRDYQIEVNRELAKYELAKATYLRFKELVRTGAVSRADYDEKKALFGVSGSKLNAVKKALNDTILRAPYDGIIAHRYVKNFQYIQAKEQIVSLQYIGDIEIIINIPEQDVARAEDIEKTFAKNKSDPVVGTATFPAIPDQTFDLRVKEFKTEASVDTQTYKATLIMPSPKNYIILPGMTADVKIKFAGSGAPSYLIPATSIAYDPKGQAFVWLVDEKNMTVNKQSVKVGAITNDRIQILSGLKPGQSVVTAGVSYLEPGMKIKIIEGRIGKQ